MHTRLDSARPPVFFSPANSWPLTAKAAAPKRKSLDEPRWPARLRCANISASAIACPLVIHGLLHRPCLAHLAGLALHALLGSEALRHEALLPVGIRAPGHRHHHHGALLPAGHVEHGTHVHVACALALVGRDHADGHHLLLLSRHALCRHHHLLPVHHHHHHLGLLHAALLLLGHP